MKQDDLSQERRRSSIPRMANSASPRRLFIISICLMLTGGIGMIYQHWPRGQQGLDEVDVELAGHVYQVEVALTPQQHEIGLMHRTRMPKDHGMLFVFPQQELLDFWMKDTKIPLDILYFDQGGLLVKQYRNVPPCVEDPCASYPSQREARYVLELNAGQAQSLGLTDGSALRKHD